MGLSVSPPEGGSTADHGHPGETLFWFGNQKPSLHLKTQMMILSGKKLSNISYSHTLLSIKNLEKAFMWKK